MIDKRRHYVLVVDTETANTLTETIPAKIGEDGEIITPERVRMDMSNVLVYDCGWAVVDTKGNIYETASFVNRDIFNDERDLMRTAYYNWKIPRYVEELRAGSRKMATTYEIRQAMLDTIERYGIKEVAAYNARFDDNALRVTQRWVTCSKFRYWFPFDSVEIWDIMKMTQDVICQMPTYKKFCEEHGYVQANGVPRKTAEIVWRFISGNTDFEESHTGLEDVLIEAEIMWYCMRQHKPMRKALYENKREFPPMTDFQRQLSASLRQIPTIRVGA